MQPRRRAHSQGHMMTSEAWFADTNLFLRYLTNDLPDQASAVEQLLRAAAAGEVELVTTSLVIAEIASTLESYYERPRQQIAEAVLAIANTPGLTLTDRDLVVQAAVWYAEKNVDFADAYNAAWALSQGLSVACTFDHQHFSRIGGLRVVSPG